MKDCKIQHGKKAEDTVAFPVRIHTTQLRQIKVIAAMRDRSVSDMLRMALEETVAEHRESFPAIREALDSLSL